MKTRSLAALALLTGVAIGAIAAEGLHAQAPPMAYSVAEVDISDLNGYLKEYVPLVRASIEAAGGSRVAAGQNPIALDGEPPKTRVTINQFESMEKLLAWRKSAPFLEARKVGDRYAKFRVFAFEASPQ
jgi:uncharacterized protein (DUF1330 family)